MVADLVIYFSTDKAVLAVNGFAADGNMFVKKVKQRLEVCTRHTPSRIRCSHLGSLSVSA